MNLFVSRKAQTALGGVALLLLTGCASTSTAAQGGGSADIPIGETMALSGVSGAYGKGKLDGQQAMIDAINDAGGVNGRKIKLTFLDDALDPAKAVQNTRKLLADGNVAQLTGTGSGSLNAILPLLSAAKVPMLFPAKTDPAWVDKADPSVFSIIPTYRDQSAAIIKHALQQDGPGKVFFVATQSPDLNVILATAQRAVEENGGTWAGSNQVPFGTADVAPFALQAAQSSPDYIVFASAPAETTKIVAALAANKALPSKKILGLTSMPGVTYLHGVPTAASEMTLSFSATVPLSDDGAKACVEALKKFKSIDTPDLVNLAGCNEARMLASTLKEVQGEITSGSIMKALNSMKDANLSPLVPAVSFSMENHMGLAELPLVGVRAGEYVSVGKAQVPLNRAP